MSWDDDDDWEAADLTLPGGGNDDEKEDWSDEEGHDTQKLAAEDEAKAKAAAAAAYAAHNKPKERTELEKKIDARERREAEEAAKKAALKKKLALDSVPDGELDEKARQKKAQEAAALDDAMDAFGVTDAGGELDAGGSEFDAMDAALDSLMGHHPKGKAATQAARAPAGPSSIESMTLDKAKSDKEFEQLATAINKHLVQYEGQRGHLVLMKALMKASTANMNSEDCKEVSGVISVISNDKIKAEKAEKADKGKKGTGKKGKLNIKNKDMAEGTSEYEGLGSGGGGGWTGGGGGRDDDYDFM